MSLLDVRDLTIRTGDGRDLVAGLGFSVDRGERLGLIGESGSGQVAHHPRRARPAARRA